MRRNKEDKIDSIRNACIRDVLNDVNTAKYATGYERCAAIYDALKDSGIGYATRVKAVFGYAIDPVSGDTNLTDAIRATEAQELTRFWVLECLKEGAFNQDLIDRVRAEYTPVRDACIIPIENLNSNFIYPWLRDFPEECAIQMPDGTLNYLDSNKPKIGAATSRIIDGEYSVKSDVSR